MPFLDTNHQRAALVTVVLLTHGFAVATHRPVGTEIDGDEAEDRPQGDPG